VRRWGDIDTEPVMKERATRMLACCQVPIWASSIGPSRHALLASGPFGHGTSGEIQL